MKQWIKDTYYWITKENRIAANLYFYDAYKSRARRVLPSPGDSWYIRLNSVQKIVNERPRQLAQEK